MASQTAEPDHAFAGDRLVPAATEVQRFDDVGVDRAGWVRIEVQRKADRIRIRCRDRAEVWTIEISQRTIEVSGPNGERSVPEWVRETVTWSAIDPSLTAARVP